MKEHTKKGLTDKTFFLPWVGEKYEEGFNGAKTMILAPHHWCAIKEQPWKDCEYKYKCCSPFVREQNEKCPYPEYKGLKLSDEDIVEIQRFIDPPEGARHEVFIQFACGLLNIEEEELTKKKKKDLCDKIIFHNFLQHYIPQRETPPYSQEIPASRYLKSYKTYQEMYGKSVESLKEVLETYSPDILITWSDAIMQTLRTHINSGDLEILVYEGVIEEFKVASKKVYIFRHKDFRGETKFNIGGTKVETILEEYFQQCNKKFDIPAKKEIIRIFVGLLRLNILDICENKLRYVSTSSGASKRNEICRLIRLNTALHNDDIKQILGLTIELNKTKNSKNFRLEDEIMELFPHKY
jgi:hypothetical protein